MINLSSSATRTLIDRLTVSLGAPIATPAMIGAGKGKLEPPAYRVFRWPCPACHAGYNDPLGLYSPFVADSGGRVFCEACHCSATEIAAAIRRAGS
jgi:hypothetical protein